MPHSLPLENIFKHRNQNLLLDFTNCILVVTVVGKRVKHALASPPTVGQWASCGFSCYYLCFIIHSTDVNTTLYTFESDLSLE